MLDAASVVKEPAAAAVPPIAGGEARYVLKPAPDTVLDAASVVKEPAAAAVPPIAGGDARYVLNPTPETVLDADNVVNEPAAAEVPPIAGGDARYVLNPAPDTVLEAAKVVKAPELAVVAPTVPLKGPASPPAVSVVLSNVRFAESVSRPPVVLYTTRPGVKPVLVIALKTPGPPDAPIRTKSEPFQAT